jgi:hypothetical protein
MSATAAFVDAIRALHPKPTTQIFPVTVTAVQADTCTIRLIDADIELDEVRLKATPGDGSEKGIRIYPKVGSFALVGLVNDDTTDLLLLQCDELQQVVLFMDSAKITVNGDNVTVENGTVNAGKNGLTVSIGDKLIASKNGVTLELDSALKVTKGALQFEVGDKVKIAYSAGGVTTSLSGALFDLITAVGQCTSANPAGLSASLSQVATKIGTVLG